MIKPGSRALAWVTIAVVAHLIVVLLHGQAHTRLGVGLSTWQNLYVITVIVLAPLVALAFSFTRYNRIGLWLLLTSMLGSLIFGACYHYLIISTDHVAHLPPGEARGLFRSTALLLLITETFGVIVAAMLMKLRRALLALIMLSVLPVGISAQERSSLDVSGARGEMVSEAYREGFAAFRKRDWLGAANALKKAYDINPKDDMTVYLIASGYGLAGDKANAIEWLHKLAELRSCFTPSRTTFASFVNTEEFKKALQEIEANRPRVHHSSVAFTVTEKDLVPEGMGYDPVEKVFYLSSLHKRKIIKVTPGVAGQAAKFQDFTSEAQDSLYCVLGIKIDDKRRILWAISSAEPFMKGYSAADDGRAALFAYDLRTRKLIKKFVPNTPGPHLLNDLVLDGNGSVFLTDTRSKEILALRQGKDELEVLVPPGRFDGPNGITISADGRFLFIASIPMGVYRLDLKTNQLERVAYPAGISLAGIDGLYFYRNSLIGVLNIINGGRVARFYLNSSLDRVTRTEIIECNNPLFDDPTTGALAGDSLYYIANSQFQSAFDKGMILPTDKLHDVIILRAKL